MTIRLKGKRPTTGEVDRRYYFIDLQESGRRVRVSTGSRDKNHAQQAEQAVLDALRKDITLSHKDILRLVRGDPKANQLAARQGGSMTLRELSEECCRDRRVWGGIKRLDAPRSNASVLCEILGANTPVAQLGQEAMDKVIATMSKQGRANGTINRKLSTLRVMLRAAQVHFRDRVPGYTAPTFSKLREPRGREYTLTDAHRAAIFSELHRMQQRAIHEATLPGVLGRGRKADLNAYRSFYVVLLETGMRPGELMRVRQDDIMHDRKELRLWRSAEMKNGRGRALPLRRRSAWILRQRRHLPGGPFATINKTRSARMWRIARKAVGITNPECIPYSLRHTAATELLDETGDLRLVSEWLGHTNITTTTRYAKVLGKRMKDVALRMDAR